MKWNLADMNNRNHLNQDVPSEPEFSNNYTRPILGTRTTIRDTLRWNAPLTLLTTLASLLFGISTPLPPLLVPGTFVLVIFSLGLSNLLSLIKGLSDIEESNSGFWLAILVFIAQLFLFMVACGTMLIGFG